MVIKKNKWRLLAGAMAVTTVLAGAVPAKSYTILGGFGFGDSFNELAARKAAVAGGAAIGFLVFDMLLSQVFGMPSLFSEISGTSTSSPRFSFASADDEALGYAKSPRRADRAPMITKALVQQSPVSQWSGVYGGFNLGVGLTTNGWRDTFGDVAGIPNSTFVMNGAGVVGGGQIGFNMQQGRWVFGLEGSFSGSSTHARSVLNLPPATGTFETKINWLASVTGRLGYAMPVSLVYLKGGIAFAELQQNMRLDGAVGPFIFPSQTSTETGWTIGAGVERQINHAWSFRSEWNYYDFGRNRYNTSLPAFGPARIDVETTLHVVSMGVNYRFNAAPLVARY